MQFTCTKRWSDIPFAHRAPHHDGCCRHIHGHSWAVEIEVMGPRDRNGFVVDFGKLSRMKAELSAFDHALVIAENDPYQTRFIALEDAGLCRLVMVPDTSCEGLARWFADVADAEVRDLNESARVVRCTVFEDSRNSGSFYPTADEPQLVQLP